MQRRFHEYVPFTGEGTGMIRDILPAADIVRKAVAEAHEILDRVQKIGIAK